MPIDAYHGNTFVAFLDISGFKALMQTREKARDALDNFFQTGYEVLRKQDNVNLFSRVDGLFVSDCGILFSRHNGENDYQQLHMAEALSSLLSKIEEISRRLLKVDLMLTTSIAYGRFDFDGRLEFQGMVKNMMYGYAYLNAYLDNESGKPKLNPGQCRILTENLDETFLDSIKTSNELPFDRINQHPSDNNHLYFYWMVRQSPEIEDFKIKYKDTYNLKYRGMLDALKAFSANR